jgi:catechol 2,3-dioxygenase-like lactoylglutathione lyase family enzyme
VPVEIVGVDHVYVAVRDLAASVRFYDPVMRILGFRRLEGPLAGEPHVHYYNRQLGFTLRPARTGTPAHDPYAPGLHHLCFRVLDEAAVDRAAQELRAVGVALDGPRACPEYAPDYYAAFFRDPDGVRLELCNFWEGRRKRMFDWDAGTAGASASYPGSEATKKT